MADIGDARFTIKAIDQTKAAFNSVQSSMARMNSSLRTIKAGFLALLGVSSIAALFSKISQVVRGTINDIENLGDLLNDRDRIGIDYIKRSFDSAKRTIEAFIIQIIRGLGPIIVWIGDHLTRAARKTKNFGDVSTTVYSNVANAIAWTLDAYRAMEIMILRIKISMYEQTTAIMYSFAQIAQVYVNLRTLMDKDYQIPPWIAALPPTVQDLIDKTKLFRTELDALRSEGSPGEAFKRELEARKAEIEEYTRGIMQYRQMIADQNEGLEIEQTARTSKEAALQAQITRKKFEIMSDIFGQFAEGNQAAAFAQAVINAYLAYSEAMAYLPPPWSYAVAALSFAQTMNAANAIKTQDVGPDANAGSLAAPTAPNVAAPSGTLNVTLAGNNGLSVSQARDLLKTLAAVQKDMGGNIALSVT